MLSYRDLEFGEVWIIPNRWARRLIFRVKEGVLRVTCPMGYSVKNIKSSIEEHRIALRRLFTRTEKEERRPQVAVGDEIPYYKGKIVLLSGPMKSRFLFRYESADLQVFCPKGCDLNNEQIWAALSKGVCRLMKVRAQEVLPQRLEQIAARLGLSSVPVSIGRGSRKLGHCTVRGEIQLSYRLMFYPEDIVDYIICHELAHLTHMNHSPEFHTLCNQYCNGQEAILRKKANTFKALIS